MDKDKNSLFRYISKFDTDSSVTLFNKGCFIPINVLNADELPTLYFSISPQRIENDFQTYYLKNK